MTLLLPFLPVYVEQLGVREPRAVAQWAGIAYGATFMTAAIVAPLWGRLSDRYGRKIMLIRASLGMAIAMGLMGMAQSVWQLVVLRLLAGFLGGFASGSMLLVAAQAPKAKSGWALGIMSSGIMAGNLVGPLVGGTMPNLIGIRATFLYAGGSIFLAFLATLFLIKEEHRETEGSSTAPVVPLGGRIDRRAVTAMLAVGILLMVCNMSIEPIITIFVAEFVAPRDVTLVAGITMSAAALGSIVSATYLGRLADRYGHWNVIIISIFAAAALLVPQAYVTAAWQIVLLRLLMGVALGGLLPCITSVIRHSVPDTHTGRILGLSTSSQYLGQVAGPVAGGFFGGHFGMRSVFLGTCCLMAMGGVFTCFAKPRSSKDRPVATATPQGED
ncbi:MFS transporter [Rhizobium leguminosarum]|nr:MFS transporter [Rhizobium leguminosarum]TBG07014.1 MFS transporter [Rhizobium leguminosarum]TBG07328.1 MFS transporter [Rhizobium leguminosarum]TBG30705.1 MFS transporter [Rhizobium leguminosarum]TBG49698.1 MFS transporter [Rhizobium leguminosarum]